jgi:hypothetical protein
MLVLPSRLKIAPIPRSRETHVKKLSLDIDELTVESFDTAKQDDGATGTVHGHLENAAENPDVVAVPYTQGNTCPGYPTCNNSCQSCMQTCGYTYYPCCQYA